ncbi:MAG TPA: hypothetical protein VHA75_09550 [Rugosimonospora sp.]|nr:hypothetical protein [Rugosimonospora sp.]
MYAWIWRHLPFRRAGRLVAAVALVVAAAGLLWYLAFPVIDSYAPFNHDGSVSTDTP